jgi:DNA polymerase-3 subunit beta
MNTLPFSDFPELTFEGPVKADFTVPAAGLLAAIDASDFCISTEETRYYLNGIYLHVPVTSAGSESVLRVVATDGHRMARHDLGTFPDMGTDWGVIVPRRTVHFLRTVLKAKGCPDSVRVVVNTTKVRFVVGNVDVLTKTIDGTFPDYQRVIPTGNDKPAVLNRKAFIEAVKAVSCLSSERGRAVKLDLADGNMALSVHNPDTGTSAMDLAIGYDFQPLTIGFNASYLLDIFGGITSETVTVRFADPGTPALIEGDAATLYVLMPMRV